MDPHQLCAVLSVRDCAVATSGTYERGGHIIDGRSVRELLSLTVIAPDLTTADATSTAAFAMGTDGVAWADTQPDCLVFAVDARQRVHRSAELHDAGQHDSIEPRERIARRLHQRGMVRKDVVR